MSKGYILAGDIGGTKTILALTEPAESDCTEIEFFHLTRYDSKAYDSLEAIVEEFLSQASLDRSKTVASFGIAGAINNGICQTTNLPWTVDEKKAESTLSLSKVHLINDFTAATLGVPCLKDSDKIVLNEGEKNSKGPMAVIGAGTGLGEGFAFYSEAEGEYKVFPSEGGHATFSPTNDKEMDLLKYLMKKFGHVSFERLLSGQGLVNIYNFLLDNSQEPRDNPIIAEMKNNDPAAVITGHAIAGSDKLSERALNIFLSIYGSEAGNVALKFIPYGGLYIGGGIAPKVSGKFKEETFMKAFLNKGRMADLLRQIPVEVVLNEELGLIGAAARGREIIKKYDYFVFGRTL